MSTPPDILFLGTNKFPIPARITSTKERERQQNSGYYSVTKAKHQQATTQRLLELCSQDFHYNELSMYTKEKA